MAAKLLSANPREISEDDIVIARSATDAEIPVIDFGPFLSGSPADRRCVADEIAQACESIGFFTLINHSVPVDLMRRAFEQSARFYAAPAEIRQSVAATNDWFRGWIAQPAAATAANDSQMFEQFRFQAEWEPFDGEGARYNHLYNLPMKWPSALPGFRETCIAYLEAGSRLGGALLHAFAMGLGLPQDRFDRYFEKPLTQANLLYYLPLPADADPAMSNIVAHTDSPPLTILAQDANGGLEVCRRDGEWITAPPVENAFTVNVGNMMMWWSHGRYVSTPHRVKNRRGRVRYSIPMFIVPDQRVVVAPLPELGCSAPTSDFPPVPDFPPVLVGEHMAQYYRLRQSRPAQRD